MKPLISIIVPVYNIEPYLARCLDSILSQTYTELEVMVINDGSVDGSAAIIDAYAEKDARIVPIHKKNGGVSAARIDGIRASHGEYIGFVDGDDIIDPDMYERLLANLLANDADISHCGHQVHEMDADDVEFYGNDGKILLQDFETATKMLIKGDYQPGLWNKLYKKDLLVSLIESNVMDLSIRMHEDLLMNYYLFSTAKQIVFEGFCPYHYIKREGSATTCKPVLWKYRDPVRVNEIMYDNAANTPFSDVATYAFVSQLVHMYRKLICIPGDEFAMYAKELRAKLVLQKKNISLLSKKQKLSAYFILYAPGLFRFLNALYKHF